MVRENTIYKPGKWVFRILSENRDEGIIPTANGRILRNIIYTDSRLSTEVNVGGGTNSGSFAFRENWWFSQRITISEAKTGWRKFR